MFIHLWIMLHYSCWITWIISLLRPRFIFLMYKIGWFIQRNPLNNNLFSNIPSNKANSNDFNKLPDIFWCYLIALESLHSLERFDYFALKDSDRELEVLVLDLLIVHLFPCEDDHVAVGLGEPNHLTTIWQNQSYELGIICIENDEL